MGGTRVRAPVNELVDPLEIDDGTLARTESDPPGVIGLDSTGGGQTSGQTPVSYAQGRLGTRVGNGECFTLVDRALRAGGFKSAADFGTVAPEVNYVWGSSVPLSDLRANDIIQFRNYRFDRSVVTTTAAAIDTQEDFQERPHHTAIVESVDADGRVTVLEQNAPDGAPLSRSVLFFAASDRTVGTRRTTIAVRGTWWFYRPQTR